MYQWREQGLTYRDAVHFNRFGGAKLGAQLEADIQLALFGEGAANPPSRPAGQ